jgi:signal transduction histidine kinase
MTRIIEDLLDISRMDSGQLAIARGRVPAAVLLADAQESLSSQVASRGLSFQRQAPDTLPVVSADAPRIQQVFDNLVGNALKFTERGTIAIGARDHVNEVEFWVADTGRGIEPEHLAHVFDRFWQARPGRRMGAGLGLAIVKGIVEAHGGRMRIESALGVGTTVFFSLPVADESSVRVATAPERLSSITEG